MARKPQLSAEATAAPKKNTTASTIKMVRNEPIVEGGPCEADVHPNEVDGWIKAGWRKKTEK